MEDLFDDLEDFGSFDDVVSGNVRDPYPELARLRREEPIQRIDASAMPGEEGKPVFIVYRYEEAQQMLRDNETFSSSGVIAAFGPVLGERVMLGMDEPVHGRLRSLVSKAFSQKAMARWEDELVGRVGNGLIDEFAATGKADLVKEFTFAYPSQIIAGLLGLPEEDYPQFQRWSISLLSWIMNPERGLAASAALCEYFAPILEARRVDPKDDMISRLIAADIPGENEVHRGHEGFLRFAERWREGLGPTQSVIEEAWELPDGRLFTLITTWGTGARSGADVDLRYVQLATFDGDKMTRSEIFTDLRKGRAAAGLEP